MLGIADTPQFSAHIPQAFIVRKLPISKNLA